MATIAVGMPRHSVTKRPIQRALCVCRRCEGTYTNYPRRGMADRIAAGGLLYVTNHAIIYLHASLSLFLSLFLSLSLGSLGNIDCRRTGSERAVESVTR